MWILKRNEPHIKTNIKEKWTTFNQMVMVQNKVVHTNAINIEYLQKNIDKSSYNIHRKYNNFGYKIIRIKFNGETKKLTGKGDKLTDDYQD